MRRAFGTIKTRKGKPGFYVKFAWQGRAYRRHAGPTRSGAASKLAKAHADLERGMALEEVLSSVFGDPRGSRMTFRDAAPLYLEHAQARKKASTFAADVRRLRPLLAATWAGKYLSEIRPEDLARFIDERRAGGAAGPTINRDLALVSALYKWAIRLRYADENPASRKHLEWCSERGRERETYLASEECRALVDTAGPVLRPILVTALSTGMRRGELLALRWCDLDLDRRTIFARPEEEKAGRGRSIPMTPDLHALLRDLARARQERKIDGTDPVFVGNDGAALGAGALRGLFESAVARCAEIALEKRPKVTFHTLRHTAASLMVQAGVPLLEVAKILGHSTLAVTMRYAHFAPEHGRKAIDLLGSTLSFGSGGGKPQATAATS